MNIPHMSINGSSFKTDDHFDVVNPATGKAFAQCGAASESDLNTAVVAARAAFPAWAATPIDERAALITKCADAIQAAAPEIGKLISTEQGKPFGNGIGEVMGALAWTRAATALRPRVETVQDDELTFIEVHRKPLGVVASISPWNVPVMITCWHIIPALMAGNTVVLKPSEMTPFGVLRMTEIMAEILPAGVINSVSGEGNVGAAISAHPDINKIVFTGSVGTGKRIMQSGASNLKRLTLELGGNDAAIVMADADIDLCVDNIFIKSFMNSGQICAALKRLYVHESIHDQLVEAMVKRAKAAKVGAADEEGVQFGPVQNKKQFDYVNELAQDTVANGGRFAVGGKPMDREGYFFPLSIAVDVKDGMRIVDEEPFGPILPIIKFSDPEEALKSANAAEVGLGGSIWTRDVEKGIAFAKRLECGTAWVNDHATIAPNAPFGGAKQSGIGTEFGHWGFEDYMQLQTIRVNKTGGKLMKPGGK